MGLAERRAVEKLKTGDCKKFADDVASCCGFPVNVEIDWAAVEGYRDIAGLIEREAPKRFWFDYTLAALKSICADQMGRDAVKAKLNKIVFADGSGDVQLVGGTLTIKNSLYASGYKDDASIARILEAAL